MMKNTKRLHHHLFAPQGDEWLVINHFFNTSLRKVISALYIWGRQASQQHL